MGLCLTISPNWIIFSFTGGAIGDCASDTFTLTAPNNKASPVICGTNTGQHSKGSSKNDFTVLGGGGQKMFKVAWCHLWTTYKLNTYDGPIILPILTFLLISNKLQLCIQWKPVDAICWLMFLATKWVENKIKATMLSKTPNNGLNTLRNVFF